MAKKQWSELDPKKHGVGGLIAGKLRERKQDKRAKSAEMYAVVFFPKIHGIGKARIGFYAIERTLSQTAEAAKVKFMDGIAPSENWERYHDAGHRIRSVKILDLGDA